MGAPSSLGKYAIRRQLGVGAMGTVYEGWDPFIERLVAIKTVQLPDETDAEMVEAIARFRREAQAAGRLTHPNIVGVFDYGETEGLAYIVMEFVDGPSLKSLLDNNRTLPLPTVARIMEDLLAGLQFSHECGVVHRDIKPANVMLTTKGQAKVADFGIARIENSNMTQAGTMLGTPAYMAPEQFMGLSVDARSDIYSCGVLLYQLLTGQRPFEGSMTAIMHKALHTDPPPPSGIAGDVPVAFDPVVRRAMAKQPEDRFDSATAFMAAIRGAMKAAASPVDPESDATVIVPSRVPQAKPAPAVSSAPLIVPSDGGRKRLGVSPLMIGAGAAGLAVLGGGAYFLLMGSAVKPVRQPVAMTRAGPEVAPAPRLPVLPEPPAAPAIPLPAPPLAPPPLATPLERARSLAAALPCAALRVADGPRVSGFAFAGPKFGRWLADLRESGPVTDDVSRVDQSACALMGAISPFVRPTWDSAPVGLTVRPAQREVVSGARLGIDVVSQQPALYVDVFQNDGSVRHVLRPPRSGGVSSPHVEFVAGPATGVSFVVAVGAASALELGVRPDLEKASEYLPILRSRLEGAGTPPLADIALVTVRAMEPPVAKVRLPEPGLARAPAARPAGLRSSRCSNILARAELGEVLSDEELAVLRTQCRS